MGAVTSKRGLISPASSPHRGFTLIELLVVMLILAILASAGAPVYLRCVEEYKASSMISTMDMVGTANRMFAVGHSGNYVSGGFTPNTGCGPGICPSVPPFNNSCILVWCKYLADQDFSSKSYDVKSCDANVVASCATSPPGRFTAAAHREPPAAAPYDGWKYTMDASGVITAYGGAPASAN